jgi:hypothetical protein
MNNYLTYKQVFCVKVYSDQNLIGEQNFVSTLQKQTGFETITGRIDAEFGADNWNRIELIKVAE